MGNSLGCSQEEEQFDRSNQSSQRTYSIFKDIKSQDKLKQRFGYEEEFKIGPYFQGQQDTNQKIGTWEKMAKKSQKKKKLIQPIQSSNRFIVNKIDTMLYEIQQTNQESFTKNILNGPPVALRWGSWKTILSKNVLFESGKYEKLIENLEDDPDYQQIKKDILRTFPNQYYFSHSGIVGKSLGHQQLHRVLGAISKYFPGAYCQSMNFILGFLIMVSGGNEIDAFWCFVSLVKNRDFLIIGLYEDGMPLLKFMEFITEKLLDKHLPQIKEKFEELMVPNGFWLVKWYMTMYIYAFPVSVCLRIWDFVLTEGIFGLVYVIIPILKLFEDYILQMEELDEVEQFQELTRQDEILEDEKNEFFMDMTKIIKQAQKYRLRDKDIVNYAREYMEQNPHFQNEYVEMYLKFDDTKEFQKLVDEFMAPKVYTHPSRSQLTSASVDNLENLLVKNDVNKRQLQDESKVTNSTQQCTLISIQNTQLSDESKLFQQVDDIINNSSKKQSKQVEEEQKQLQSQDDAILKIQSQQQQINGDNHSIDQIQQQTQQNQQEQNNQNQNIQGDNQNQQKENSDNI